MLHEFLTANRNELINRCRLKVVLRDGPLGHPKLEHGVPLFLDQLVKTLRVERTAEPLESRKVSGPEGGGNRTISEIGETATLHGRELLKHGFTVDQVVHDYGDLCQAITDLAFERDAQIEIDEFRTLNRCLDNAIAVSSQSAYPGIDYRRRWNSLRSELSGTLGRSGEHHEWARARSPL